MVETFSHVNHLKAFALIILLMIGSFTVFPYLPSYLEQNVGMQELQLPWVYVAGGALTLFSAPICGKLADQYGKLIVYSVLIPISAVLLVVITHLPPSPLYVAVIVFGLLMVCNVGRMIAAMAMVISSVEPRRRGAFLSANASVQHIASGFGAYLGGVIVSEAADGKIEHFGKVGWVAAAATLSTVWIASRIRVADQVPVSAEAMSFAAAAEATMDAGEPMFGYGDITHG
jgi:predicted MFS family arabinose efflux permease